MTRVVPFIAADLALPKASSRVSAKRASPGESTKFLAVVRENVMIYVREATLALAEADALLDGAGAAPSSSLMRRVAALDARHIAMREAAGRWATVGLPYEAPRVSPVEHVKPLLPPSAEEVPSDVTEAEIAGIYQRVVRGTG